MSARNFYSQHVPKTEVKEEEPKKEQKAMPQQQEQQRRAPQYNFDDLYYRVSTSGVGIDNAVIYYAPSAKNLHCLGELLKANVFTNSTFSTSVELVHKQLTESDNYYAAINENHIRQLIDKCDEGHMVGVWRHNRTNDKVFIQAGLYVYNTTTDNSKHRGVFNVHKSIYKTPGSKSNDKQSKK